MNFKLTVKILNSPEVWKKSTFWLHPLKSNSGSWSLQAACDDRELWDMNDSHRGLDKHCTPVSLNPLRIPFCLYDPHIFYR